MIATVNGGGVIVVLYRDDDSVKAAARLRRLDSRWFPNSIAVCRATRASATGSTPSAKPFEVYTHCGIESARIHGRWWHAEPPLYNKARSGPPPGWGDPYQPGTLTLQSVDRATFEALGQKVVFVPAPDNQPVRICD